MALTELDGSVVASMFIRITDNNYNVPNIIINNPVNQRYAFGTDAGQIDIAYSAELTIAPSATTSLILNDDTLEDLFGNALNFATIKSIRVQHKSNSSSSSINLQGDFMTTNFGTSFSIAYPPGGYFDISESSSGFAVVETTGDTIDLVNNDATNTATVSVELLGIKAILGPYIIQVKTDNVGSFSNDDQFISPFPTSGSCDLTINYNNGERIDVFTDYSDHSLTYTFLGGAGTYDIQYSGSDYRDWQFIDDDDDKKIIEIKQWGGFIFTKNQTFSGCSNMIATWTDTPRIETSDMSLTFSQNTLLNGDFTNWPMDNVTDISNMYLFCSAHTGIGIDTWNMPGLTTMASAFIFTIFNNDLSSWPISNLTTASICLFGVTTYTQANYDLLLIAWAAKPHLNNVPFNANVTQFSAGAAAAAHAVLVSDGWIFTDGGQAP